MPRDAEGVAHPDNHQGRDQLKATCEGMAVIHLSSDQDDQEEGN